MNVTPNVCSNYLFFSSYYLILEEIFDFIGISFSPFLPFEI
jgi:hypothetical protein